MVNGCFGHVPLLGTLLFLYGMVQRLHEGRTYECMIEDRDVHLLTSVYGNTKILATYLNPRIVPEAMVFTM